jgi:hypothetical protein
MDESPTYCEGCGKQTPTIAGMCPNCGGPKTALAARRAPRDPSLSNSLFDLVESLIGSAFGLAALVMLALTIVYFVLRQISS